MRFALDTNVLVYGFLRDDPAKHATAANILIRCDFADVVVPAQVLGEFLNVVRRKQPDRFIDAVSQVENWRTTWTILPTKDDHVVDGAALARSNKLQLWDAIIWQVAASAQARLLLSEDLQDHLTIDTMKVLNPFEAGNEAAVEQLFATADNDRDGNEK